MSAAAVTTENAFHTCAQLLRQLHELIAAGVDDHEEAEALRARMDPLWYAMSEQERERLGGLSEDLYILAEGGAKQVDMSPQEDAHWSAETAEALEGLVSGRDVDAALRCLRRPAPRSRPRYMIPFLQARCWERLGEDELALVFMTEAARLDARQAVCVMLILERLGRHAEAAEWARRIIDDPKASAEELYQAAATLLRPTQQQRPADARPVLESLVPVLERALRVFLTTPVARREIQDADRYIITMLAFFQERLGNLQIALRLYNDGLRRYPGDAALLTFRGLALLDVDVVKALDDFARAVQAGSQVKWPHYFLAWASLRAGKYLEAWQQCLRALELPGGSDRETAQLHEWLGIALTESGQAGGWVLSNFDRALALDPDNPRIRHNRAVAKRRAGAADMAPTNGWMIDGRPTSKQAMQGTYPETRRAPDLLIERSDRGLAALLAPA
jgi:tetratricopeptide (TPR) repeat protein